MAKAPKKGSNGSPLDESENPLPEAAAAPIPVPPSSPIGAAPGGDPAGQRAAQQAPSMRILGQYLKDLSFENPNAPQSLGQQQGQPEINISVNVNAKPLQQKTDFEVELHLEAKATHTGKVMFAAEVLYAGVFRLENIPQEALHPIVLIECPRMIFPFARQVLADATRNGGFPPLMLDPIDFATMYQKRVQEARAAGGAPVSA